jgi:hypothetical protein
VTASNRTPLIHFLCMRQTLSPAQGEMMA